MAEHNYTPTLGMVRELARADIGEACAEPEARERCIRRGLLSFRGGVTGDGRAVLRRAVQQFQIFGETRHG